jgi:hypothetical protein
MTNIFYLHARPDPVSLFLRIGPSGHRRLEQLLAAGQLPIRRFVVEAGAFGKQNELISALRQNKNEIVLDTNVAELSVIGRYQGAARGAPWRNPDGILTEAHFKSGSNEFDVIGKIARFVVAERITRVQAPAHLITGVLDPWFAIDVEACERLRRTLDVEGGREVAIDYPLMISNAVLNDPSQRREFVATLSSMPIDSLWVRVAGFGANATAAGLRKYISAVQDLHTIGRPVIADGVGGLSALAIVAFGAACGIAHGVAEKERFDTNDWHKPPKEGGGGGGYAMLLPGIDRLLKRSDAKVLVAAPGGRRLLSCNNRACCPHGFDDMIKDPKGHYLRQRAWQCEAISAVPENRRSQHFLDKDLAQADRIARQIANLKVSDYRLAQKMEENSRRLDRMRVVLENLDKTSSSATRSPAFAPIRNLQVSIEKDTR